MKKFIILTLLFATAYSAKAQDDNQTFLQVKKLIEKIPHLKVEEGMYLYYFTNIHLDAAPCVMHYYYNEEWQDEYGEGTKGNYLTELNWKDVISVTPSTPEEPLYIKIAANEKGFATFAIEAGNLKPDKATQTIYIPTLFLNGITYDQASFDKTLGLIKKLTISCGGKIK